MPKEYLKKWRKNQLMLTELLEDSSNSMQEEDDVLDTVNNDCELNSDNTESYQSIIDSEEYSSEDDDVFNVENIENGGDEEEEVEQQTSSLSSELGAWAAENHCTHSSVNGLLNILRSHGHTELPNDAAHC